MVVGQINFDVRHYMRQSCFLLEASKRKLINQRRSLELKTK